MAQYQYSLVDVQYVKQNPEEFIIPDCLDACKILWEKGIDTTQCSNFEDKNCRWIEIDVACLSKENYNYLYNMINSKVDFGSLKNALDSSVKAVLIQRSKGYDWRDTYSVDGIGEIVSCVKSVNKDIICIVDNCYGEFVEEKEPCEVGADLIVGSLIKNPGGGLAMSGGYIVGTKDAIEKVSYRLTCPGIGRECGSSLGNNRSMYQGFFMAPHVVCNAVKAGIFCGALFEELGYEEKLIAFCRGIQQGAPIDSFVVPAPWDMPGYENKVIMAAGAFVQGASIEISADGPIVPPYTAYFQGGLTFETAKLAILLAAQNVMNI